MGLDGSDAVLCRRIVRSNVYRLGQVVDYGLSYKGDGISISPFEYSLRRGLMRYYNYWVIIRELGLRLRTGGDISFYFRIMGMGFFLWGCRRKKKLCLDKL